MRGGLTIMVAGALLCIPATPLVAQTAAPRSETTAVRLVKAGGWRFTTRAKNRDGTPLCTEVWRFRTDGSGTVESGAERLTKRWRTGPGEGGTSVLFWQSLATNGAADCTGNIGDPGKFPLPEASFVVMFTSDGSADICNAPAAAANPDNTLSSARIVTDADCWGRLDPLPQG